MKTRTLLIGLVAAAALTGMAGLSDAAAQSECNINTPGERIYHLPGQEYYDETRISASHHGRTQQKGID